MPGQSDSGLTELQKRGYGNGLERGMTMEANRKIKLYIYSVNWNSIFRASVTLLEASRISRETRFPFSS